MRFRNVCILLLVCLTCSCEHEQRYLCSVSPAKSASIFTLLEKNGIEYSSSLDLTNEGKIAVSVDSRYFDILQKYIVLAPSSGGYVQAVMEKSCYRRGISALSVRLAAMITEPGKTTVGDVFERVFSDGNWRVFRSPNYEIIVEFRGTVPEGIRDNNSDFELLKRFTEQWEIYFPMIGPEHSEWQFRWIVGLNGRDFRKQPIRITPARSLMKAQMSTSPDPYYHLNNW